MTALSASTRTLANHIGGAWTPSAAIETLPDRDPATGELLAQVPLSTAADVDAAVRAARTAQREWRATSPLVRARAVMKLRAVLDGAERATANGKRVQALGGAKNAVVVMPDADPQLMVAGVLGSAFGAAGQPCLAGSIAVLVGTLAEQDASRALIVEAAARLRTGAGDDPATDVCPVVSPAARERLRREIDQAEADGATVVLDGRGDSVLQIAPPLNSDADLLDEIVDRLGEVLAEAGAHMLAGVV